MEENIGMVLAQVSRLMRRRFDERARDIGVTRPQWQVLSLLRHHEGINQGGLADLLDVEPITLGRMIDRLQDAELVERRADPADRRAWRLFLTNRGIDLCESLRPHARDTLAQTMEGFTPEEQQSLLDMLGRLRTNLMVPSPVSESVSVGAAHG